MKQLTIKGEIEDKKCILRKIYIYHLNTNASDVVTKNIIFFVVVFVQKHTNKFNVHISQLAKSSQR